MSWLRKLPIHCMRNNNVSSDADSCIGFSRNPDSGVSFRHWHWAQQVNNALRAVTADILDVT